MHQKQHTLWLLAAMAAPLAHFSGAGWLNTLLAALAVLPMSLPEKHWANITKPAAVAQVLWLGAVAGVLLGPSGAYWPSDNDLAVPLTILALAAMTDGASAPRIGAVLALCMALLAIPAAASGAARIRGEWLRPTMGAWPWGLSLVLLLPNLPAGNRGRGRAAVCAGVLAVLLSALVQGTISPYAAASVPDPFYQTARTLGYMEPIIASGVTLGWYALAAYLLQSAVIIAQNGGMEQRKARFLTVGTAAGAILFRVQLSAPLLTLLSLLLWVLWPVLTKLKKVEKR